jgi:phosphatidylserine/phosphatidylglycerophosphate/cardiolipin synthase-like enzyme
MNGSFNWTRQAVLENQDNVMVLEGLVNIPMINAYQRSFNMMWSKYERFVLPRTG